MNRISSLFLILGNIWLVTAGAINAIASTSTLQNLPTTPVPYGFWFYEGDDQNDILPKITNWFLTHKVSLQNWWEDSQSPTERETIQAGLCEVLFGDSCDITMILQPPEALTKGERAPKENVKVVRFILAPPAELKGSETSGEAFLLDFYLAHDERIVALNFFKATLPNET